MNIDCRICLDDIEDNNLYLQLTCNHFFHYECLSKMHNNLCPLCKKDNTELFQELGIFIGDPNESEDESEYSDDSDDSNDSMYEYMVLCDTTIDQLTYGLNLDDTFIDTINKLYVYFENVDMIHRAKTLYDRLQMYGLTIRSDSVICTNFIKNNSGTLEQTVDTMVEMDWFCNHTDYLSRMLNSMSHITGIERSKIIV